MGRGLRSWLRARRAHHLARDADLQRAEECPGVGRPQRNREPEGRPEGRRGGGEGSRQRDEEAGPAEKTVDPFAFTTSCCRESTPDRCAALPSFPVRYGRATPFRSRR